MHMERTDGHPYSVIVSGDPKVLMQGVFNLMCHMEEEYEIPFDRQMKMLKRTRKYLEKHAGSFDDRK